MARFSSNSLKRLMTCHPDIQKIMMAVIKHVDITIICGHRNRGDQNAAYDAGKSEVTYPHSKHNKTPSMAVDVGPYCSEIRDIDWDDHQSFAVLSGYINATVEQLIDAGEITHRIRWGGDWDMDNRTVDEKFRDYPHFELIEAERC